MANRTDRTPKRQALRQTGTLNPRPDRVTDELFADSDFFDPNDLLQKIKELFRKGLSKREIAKQIGISRTSVRRLLASA